jgi:rfaE bifunctional protein kinase chain/domain
MRKLDIITVLDKHLIEEILDKAKTARIAVVGDFCLDVYWFIEESASEKSLETGLPTWPIDEQTYSLGGAGNVVKNMQSLGCKNIQAYGIVGIDPWGQIVKQHLNELGINCSGLKIQEQNWATPTYVKPNIEQKELNRIDFGNFNKLDSTTLSSLLASLEKELQTLDIVVINQQVKETLFTEDFINELKCLINKYSETTFIVDSRHHSGAFPGALLKINDHEAVRLAGLAGSEEAFVPRESSLKAAETLYKKLNKTVFITRGPRGCIVVTEAGIHEIPGIQAAGKIDTVGAGDSMLAGICVALASGQNALNSATIGNFTAAVTIQKLFQTGSASPEELIKMGSEANFLWRPELAEDTRKARFHKQTEFEIITNIRDDFKVTHIIFDHDGTISVLREGWELIMERMMAKAVLGEKFESASESLYLQAIEQIRGFIDKTTGIQTLIQMQGLVEMVRDFGCVPENELKDEFAYKEIYNDALMEMVNLRVEKLRRGELARDDFLIKNALTLVETLYQRGVKLYMASGTDQHDVVEEATVLGYTDFFEGRIYGAVGDVSKEAKREVLDRILLDIGDDARQGLVTIGDGPLEIRETQKRGGLSIGIASDEIRRFGLNPGKRKRLIQAGADIIIPDYSNLEAFLDLLGV